MNKIKIGSLFSGIGGFELGLERAIPNSKTIWQCEKNTFCQKILKKHWPNTKIFDDIKEMHNETIDLVDIIIGGFPCQDISNAYTNGKAGIAGGKKSSLWKDMWKIIDRTRPKICIIENVRVLLSRKRGFNIVLNDFFKMRYDVEWISLSARSIGAPHLRNRVFAIAYPNMQRCQKQSMYAKPMESNGMFECGSRKDGRVHKRNYWQRTPIESPLCRVDDGIPDRLDRIRALGNAIVPQCSETIGRYIMQSGILDDIEEYRKIQKEINNIPW